MYSTPLRRAQEWLIGRSCARSVLPGLFALGLVGLAGCDGADGAPPISDSVYVEVLMDLALVQGRAELLGDVHGSSVDSVFAAHSLARGDFEDAAAFFAEHPDQYRARLEEAIDRLSEEKRPGLRID